MLQRGNESRFEILQNILTRENMQLTNYISIFLLSILNANIVFYCNSHDISECIRAIPGMDALW